jgi:hypothetical protein
LGRRDALSKLSERFAIIVRSGAVAQLGERLLCTEEVRGSNPLSSILRNTDSSEKDRMVGEAIQETGSDIANIFKACFSAVGGRNNTDVIGYFKSRKQKITRAAFFDAVVWAVWVSGMGRKATSTFLSEAGVPKDFKTFPAWDRVKLDTFIRRVHYLGVTPRAEGKWLAVEVSSIGV